jgi:hypothetical protein
VRVRLPPGGHAVTHRPWSDPEVDAVFGPRVGPDGDPDWPPARSTDDLPDIGNYQEEPHDLRTMRPSR